MRISFPGSLIALSVFALLSCAASALTTVDRTWLAVPASNNWNDGANWSDGDAPDFFLESAVFAKSTVHNPTFHAATSFGSLVFNPGADRYVIEINGFTVTIAGGINNASGAIQTISNGVAGGQLSLLGGSITGNVTIINSGASTVTRFTGVEGGVVRLINANPSAVFDFSGSFFPVVAPLGLSHSMTVGSIEGVGSVVLGNTQLSVGSNGLNTVFSGIISGTNGSLVKIGTGSLTLSGANTYTGNTTVLSGALYINGSIVSPLTTVGSSGLLGGTGLIAGNLANHGTVSPGNSPGTLTVSGSYRQYSDGNLRIEIAGRNPTRYDRLSVGGTAALDGTLQLVSVGKAKVKRGDQLAILTASGGVNGTFRSIDNEFDNGTILNAKIIYEPYAVIAKIVQGSFEGFAHRAGLSVNQVAVAQALDSAVGDRQANRLFDFLDARNRHDLPGDFDKIAPEELTSIFTISTALANIQSLNLQRRTDDLRSGSMGFSAGGLAINGNGPSYSGGFNMAAGVAGPSGNDGKESKEIKNVTPVDTRWGAFLSGTGEWVSVGNTDNARGYDLSSGGFTLGVDYKLTPNFALGLMAGYNGTTADLVDRGRVWVNGGKIGLYATFFQNQQADQAPTMSKDSSKEAPVPAPSIAKGFYADMAVFGGYNSYDTRRTGLQGEARGDTEGGELNVLFGTGYDFKKGAFTFGPTATFNYSYIGTNGFTEHGSLAPLDVHGGKGESLRSAFGLKASYDWKVGRVLLKPELRAAWQHEYGDAAYALDASFANGAGHSFLVDGPQLGRDSVLLGAGFAIQCSERTATYFYYDGELGCRNYQSTNVTGGLRISF